LSIYSIRCNHNKPIVENNFLQIGGPLKFGGPRQTPKMPSAKAGIDD
jgi:hypothetical protein